MAFLKKGMNRISKLFFIIQISAAPKIYESYSVLSINYPVHPSSALHSLPQSSCLYHRRTNPHTSRPIKTEYPDYHRDSSLKAIDKVLQPAFYHLIIQDPNPL